MNLHIYSADQRTMVLKSLGHLMCDSILPGDRIIIDCLRELPRYGFWQVRILRDITHPDLTEVGGE